MNKFMALLWFVSAILWWCRWLAGEADNSMKFWYLAVFAMLSAIYFEIVDLKRRAP